VQGCYRAHANTLWFTDIINGMQHPIYFTEGGSDPALHLSLLYPRSNVINNIGLKYLAWITVAFSPVSIVTASNGLGDVIG